MGGTVLALAIDSNLVAPGTTSPGRGAGVGLRERLVEARFFGLVMEPYPVQATAVEIVILR